MRFKRTGRRKQSALRVDGAIPDPKFPDCTLVPVAAGQSVAGYPKVSAQIIPNTYYRINTDTGVLRCFVTIMPDGLHCAWDTCARCHKYMTQCLCNGILHPDSVQWIAFHTQARIEQGHGTDIRIDMQPYLKNRRQGMAVPIGTTGFEGRAPIEPQRRRRAITAAPSAPPRTERRRGPVAAGGPVRAEATKAGAAKADPTDKARLDQDADKVAKELAARIKSRAAQQKGSK